MDVITAHVREIVYCQSIDFLPEFMESALIESIYISDSRFLMEVDIYRSDFPRLKEITFHNCPQITCNNVNNLRALGLTIHFGKDCHDFTSSSAPLSTSPTPVCMFFRQSSLIFYLIYFTLLRSGLKRGHQQRNLSKIT